MHKPDRKGFSLLELLVVIAIVGLVAGVVAASFSGGIRVWESASLMTRVEQEAYFGVENMRRDLVNMISFHDIKFAGGPAHVSFPGLVQAADEEGQYSRRIGTVKYIHNRGEGSLYRLAWTYPESEESAQGEVIADGVETVRFFYLVPGRDADQWEESWQSSTNFPAAVRLQMSFSNRTQSIVVERDIPLAENLWRAD